MKKKVKKQGKPPYKVFSSRKGEFIMNTRENMWDEALKSIEFENRRMVELENFDRYQQYAD